MTIRKHEYTFRVFFHKNYNRSLKLTNVLSTRRKAISPAITTIIISATVLLIGGTLWNYVHGSSSTIATNYVNDTLDLVAEVTERYTVEHVTNNTDCSVLTIWIYNYGNVKIKTDIYVSIEGDFYNSDFDNPIIVLPGERASPSINIVGSKGDTIGIQVHSRRQNDAFYTYVV